MKISFLILIEFDSRGISKYLPEMIEDYASLVADVVVVGGGDDEYLDLRNVVVVAEIHFHRSQ